MPTRGAGAAPGVLEDYPVSRRDQRARYILDTRNFRNRFEAKNRKKRAKNTPQKRQKFLARQKQGIVQAFRRAGVEPLATEIQNCRQEFVAFRCGHCGALFGQPRSCHNRFCPECANARAARILAKRLPQLCRYHNYVFLTLTLLSVKHITAENIQFAFACWNKLSRRKFMQERCYGSIPTLEVSYGPKGFHIHLHILIATRNCPLPIKDIRKAWQAYTGAKWCHIKRVYPPLGKAIRELVKYPLKPVAFYKHPEALKEYAEAIEHVQLIRGYGVFQHIREAFKPHAPLSQIACPCCRQKGYLEKIGDSEPLTNFRRTEWGWEFVPRGPPPANRKA